MTVEQPSLPPPAQGVDRNVVKIEEVTGICDRARIHNAIAQCSNDQGSYELDEVIHVLLRQTNTSTTTTTTSTTRPNPTPTQALPLPVSKINQGTETEPQPFVGPRRQPKDNKGVIDLTNEGATETDDLQKAIVASLQDSTPAILGGQISREEQEISRALEANLAENKAGTKRKRGDPWFIDPLNPHERKRKEGWPVGLKNVGNTCWFSAVIQSLFHLPVFRRLVLNFTCPKEMLQGQAAETRNLRFMQELRRLFAMAIRSQRKYLDPSKAVDILKEAFTSAPSGGIDSQQDVSEFQHKLLEWLEDTFRLDQSQVASPAHGASGSSDDNKRQANPMCRLFYGQFVAEGVNEGKSFKNEETFGQFPLQVNGFYDIYESLDAATARGEIETVNGDSTAQSRQEQWFTRLPPVLTFELSRFQFNQNLGRPEKIHNKLHFPNLIYMDRYMLANKQITRQKREELKRLKDQLSILQHKLDKFINYGSSAKRFPLHDVLQSALQFAETPPRPTSPPICDDVEMDSPKSTTMDSPKSNTSMMQTDSPMCTPKKSPTTSSPPPDITMTSSTTPGKPGGAPTPRASGAPEPEQQPAPRSVSTEELQVLQNCLTRWRKEVESDVKELQDGISSLEQTMGAMYADESLKQFAYRLHAVLVHEGQAASGHYWAYIYSTHYQTWLKFNDIMVTEASWDELEKESVGGYHNTSAYCLMYIRADSQDLTPPVDGETGQKKESQEELPSDLETLVTEDNKVFTREILDWDNEQRKRALGAGDGSVAGTSSSTQTTPPPVKVHPSPAHELARQHALFVSMSTQEALRWVLKSDTFKNKGASEALQEVLTREMKRLEAAAKLVETTIPRRDPRLHNILVYMKSNGCNSPSIIDRVLVEQFSQCQLNDPDTSVQEILLEARKEEKKAEQAMTEEERQAYVKWHHDYHEFRRVTLVFLAGVEQFHNECYASALPYLVCGCEMNDALITGGRTMKGLDYKLLYYYRRQCVLHVNDLASSQFELEEVMGETLDLMERLLLPSITLLSSTQFQDDQSAIDDVREKWCAFLGIKVSYAKIEKLQDFLAKLFDPPTETRVMYPASLKRVNDKPELAEQYRAVMELSNNNGYLEAAHNSK